MRRCSQEGILQFYLFVLFDCLPSIFFMWIVWIQTHDQGLRVDREPSDFTSIPGGGGYPDVSYVTFEFVAEGCLEINLVEFPFLGLLFQNQLQLFIWIRLQLK